ncbi:hypothetical protein D3C77_335790 [compost metagenome]
MYLAAIFSEVLEKGQREGEISKSLDSDELAHSLVVSIIGLTVIMKSKPDSVLVKHSIEVALSLLDK